MASSPLQNLSSVSHQELEHDVVQVEEAESTMIPPTLDSPSVNNATNYATGFKLVFLMIAATLASFLVLLDVSIIATAIPHITTEFHSIGDIGWYVSAYNLASSSLQPLTGKFYTYFRIKWTFLLFFFVFEIGSLVCAIATSSNMLIAGRAVAGLGSSAIWNGGLTMIGIGVPLEKRPMLLGICTGFTQLALVGGPLIGGALTEYATWRWCFYINLPLGGITAFMLLLTDVPDAQTRVRVLSLLRTFPTKFDIIGFFLFAPASIMILMALDWGGSRYTWGSPPIIGLLCGGAVAAIIFALWERRAGDNAMIPGSIIGKRQILAACLTSVFFFCTVMIMSFYLSIYFQAVRNTSPFTAGVNMLPSILSQLAFAIIGGFLVQKLGYYLPFTAVGGAILAISNGLITTWSAHTPTAKWAGYQVFLGSGRGLSTQIPVIAVQANAESDTIAITTSLLVFAQNFSGSIIVALADAVFQHVLRGRLQSRIPQSIAEAAITAGAGGFRQVIPEEYLPVVINSYLKAVISVFYISVVGSCLMTISSFGMGWKDIRKKG